MPYVDMKHPAAKHYLRQTKCEHGVAALWLKALDPEVYRRYNNRFLELKEKVEELYADDSSRFLSKTLLINAIVQPHRDVEEVQDGYVLTYPLGDFTGGDQVILDMGMRFHQEAGDLLVAPPNA